MRCHSRTSLWKGDREPPEPPEGCRWWLWWWWWLWLWLFVVATSMSRRWGRGYCGALLICTLDALELPFRFSRCSSGTEAALGHFFVVVFCSPVLAYFKLLFIVITLPSASTSTSTSLRPLPRPRSRSVLAKLMATLIYYHNNNFLAILGLLLCARGCPSARLPLKSPWKSIISLAFPFARFAGYLLCGFHGLIWDFSVYLSVSLLKWQEQSG